MPPDPLDLYAQGMLAYIAIFWYAITISGFLLLIGVFLLLRDYKLFSQIEEANIELDLSKGQLALRKLCPGLLLICLSATITGLCIVYKPKLNYNPHGVFTSVTELGASAPSMGIGVDRNLSGLEKGQ